MLLFQVSVGVSFVKKKLFFYYGRVNFNGNIFICNILAHLVL